MNSKFLLILFISIFLISCDQSLNTTSLKKNVKIEKKYSNLGFALVYNENLQKIKKIDERSLNIYHKSLKRKSIVKITNPKNKKSLIANVKSNRIKFSDFYNSIISPRIAEDLELDLAEPYIEIILVSKNSTFIAKKTKTFEEEKKVAEKAPIDGIQISDLNFKKEKTKKTKKNVFSYSIKLADFYYKDSAQLVVNRINKETSLKNHKIIKLSKTKYRVLIGPFNDINSLKESFEKIKPLNFENIEILKNV
jgi:hypothetical protein|tara:strand:- start:597 stop:1349 length:753 start_codon:yes stop_codon:yes gene_type:complete